jgi:acyl dehydratase
MTEETLITDEARAMIGRESEPITGEVRAKDIRRFCYAVGDSNPQYLDEESAGESQHGGVVAPPMFFDIPTVPEYPLEELKADGMPPPGIRPPVKALRSMAGGNEVEFFQPMRPGDKIQQVTKIADIYEKQGKSGRLVFTIYEHTYTNQDGDVVAVARQTGISW